MEHKSDTYSNSLYLRHLNHHHHHHRLPLRLCLLLLLLVLAYSPLTMANYKSNVPTDPGDSNPDFSDREGFKLPPTHARNEDKTNRENELQRQCPHSAYECPSTIEPLEAFKQLKNNLGPVIRQRLRELLKKAINIEYAIEMAHTIDLLKLLNESNPELNDVRVDMHKGIQQLRDASHKISDIIQYC